MVKRLAAAAERWLGHRYVPGVFALVAVVIMLPALNAGLGLDDLVQRTIQLKPTQLSPQIRETGFALRSGTLPAVLNDLFGFRGEREAISRARNYGVLPWWIREDVKAALWRPLTALTHWVDYRLYPDSPALMHAHNIAWFAGVVLVASLLYRELLHPRWVASLAALLFLLDKNTYFPVMYVANRGFIISLFFGLLCVYAHHRWRATRSRGAALGSILAMAASVFSNEAGVSTLAFLVAYALFLEKGTSLSDPAQSKFRLRLLEAGQRASTLLPALLTVLAWRVVYQALGFGVANVGAYIDPSREPTAFLTQVGGRSLRLLAGQLTGIVPEISMALHPRLGPWVFLAGALASGLVLLAILPLLKQDRVAQFWFTATTLTLVPAATVVPLSKNLGFVAVACFGLMAMLLARVIAPCSEAEASWLRARPPAYIRFAGVVCGVLVLAHIPGAIVGRVAAAAVTPFVLKAMQGPGNIGHGSDLADADVVVLNSPCQLALMGVPFLRAYQQQSGPNSLRSLLPGCTGFEITRVDERTLAAKPIGPNIFHCESVGKVHCAYVFARIDQFFRKTAFKPGCRISLKGLTVEVVEDDLSGLPACVTFRFDKSLEDSSFHWLYFDWRTFHYRDLQFPTPGQSCRVAGPAANLPREGGVLRAFK